MDTVNCPQIFVAVFLLARLVYVQATVISGHPNDVTVEPNVWANFSCTVHCSFSVEWYKADHLYHIKNYPDSRSIDGLRFKKSNSTCISEFKTYFLKVLATREFHNSVFYCAAYEESCLLDCSQTECKCGCGGRCYSRPAFLRVEMAAVSTTSLPTPSPSLTLQVTPKAITKTVTMTIPPTNCPTSAAVPGSSSIQVEISSSQAASAQAAILAGLGIVASIFLF